MEAMKKILVVDDDPVVGRSFDRVLTRKGYAVITATNGQDALEKLRNERYDMVFTDIKMPGMSGLEVAERVKASQPWLPVVIVTGYGNDASQARAAAAGDSLGAALASRSRSWLGVSPRTFFSGAAGIQAVQQRHANVYDCNVWFKLLCYLQQRTPICHDADHFVVGLE